MARIHRRTTQKYLHNTNNKDGMITHSTRARHLGCKVKRALGSISTNKASEGDGIPGELFQVLKGAVKVLHSICQQIWKTQQWPQDWKRSVKDYKHSWVAKNWCFWTVVLEKTLETPLDSKEIKPAHPKGNQSWIFIARTDAEAETPVLCTCWKDPDAGKDLRQEDRGWDSWMASPTPWTWVWVSFGSWWWTWKPGVL